jgi:hypothetical protein
MHCDIDDSIRYVFLVVRTAHADKPLLPRPIAWTDGFRSPASAIGPDGQGFTPIREKSHWAGFPTRTLGSVALSEQQFPQREARQPNPRQCNRRPIRIRYLNPIIRILIHYLEKVSVRLDSPCKCPGSVSRLDDPMFACYLPTLSLF